MNQGQSYKGVALAVPVTFGYAKHDDSRQAAWYIGGVLRGLIAGAGIKKQNIDGLAVSSFSLAPDSVSSLTQQFNLSPRWLEQLPFGGCSGVIAVRRAARAIQAGDAQIIACIGGDANSRHSFGDMVSQFSNFTMNASFPYGGGGPNAAFSLITQYYMQRFGASKEDFGRLAVAQRYNANHYANALFKDKKLTLDDYLNARPITSVLGLYDCVMPCAGGEGFLVMRTERAEQLNLPYCEILAADELHNAYSNDEVQRRAGWAEFAGQLYKTAGLTPQQIDLVQTYDDYPVISMLQLEDLGFCEKGQASEFVRNTDLSFDGSGDEARKLPHNTSGGQLSIGQAGSAAGYLGVVESIRQLNNQALGNQVADANKAMVSGYGMINYDRGLCSAAAILASSKKGSA